MSALNDPLNSYRIDRIELSGDPLRDWTWLITRHYPSNVVGEVIAECPSEQHAIMIAGFLSALAVPPAPPTGPEPEVWIAERIARRAHDGQKDTVTGAPYITHVERVVSMVEGADAKAVAWLHDVLEDSEVTIHDLIEAGISERVRIAVVALTRRKDQPYAEYIAWLSDHARGLPVTVKLADLQDHLHANCPKRLRPRYRNALAVLGPLPPAPLAANQGET